MRFLLYILLIIQIAFPGIRSHLDFGGGTTLIGTGDFYSPTLSVGYGQNLFRYLDIGVDISETIGSNHKTIAYIDGKEYGDERFISSISFCINMGIVSPFLLNRCALLAFLGGVINHTNLNSTQNLALVIDPKYGTYYFPFYEREKKFSIGYKYGLGLKLRINGTVYIVPNIEFQDFYDSVSTFFTFALKVSINVK